MLTRTTVDFLGYGSYWKDEETGKYNFRHYGSKQGYIQVNRQLTELENSFFDIYYAFTQDHGRGYDLFHEITQRFDGDSYQR